jgi:tRNA-specific 2-thiouridylase
VPERRAVVIGPHDALLGTGVLALGMNWMIDVPQAGDTVQAQIRHRGRIARATVLQADDQQVELTLDEPLAAITPGQSLVLYDGDRLLGGGFIERAAGSAPRRAALPILAA